MRAMLKRVPGAIWISFGLWAVEGVGLQAAGPPASPPLEHLGTHFFKITAASPAAQDDFDRGLTLAYSFGHYAAEQEFRRALAADTNCAMAYWGVALVNGPHINFPVVPPDKAAVAWTALVQAKRLAPRCSPLEQALIKALETRYANPQPDDRSSLDAAYTSAMREVWHDYPQNADVGTLFAEAAMDLHPWDFWTNGAPQPWTPEIIETLETALRLDPTNPGANHFYIHVMEASPAPAKALAEANRLRTLVPDASHMVHMPAHIYSRVGQWDAAADASHSAIKADVLYRTAYPRPGFYAMYMAHNEHFLTWVCMMQGRSTEALASAHGMLNQIPDEFLQNYAFIADGYMAIVPETQMRFGRWNDILNEPEPAGQLFLARALWRYTRVTALTAQGRPAEAAAEREAFAKAVAAVPPDRTMGNNSASDLLAIATLMLDGEIAAKTNNYEVAVVKLREAVRQQDNLRYDEPPDWIQPARHTLGAVLLRAGRPAEAEAVYREDLQKNPENGWALMGLRNALLMQGKETDAAKADARFRKAWAHADVSPKFTCYCQAGQ
jgi:tetratricopeptide (TPR) repeat protein